MARIVVVTRRRVRKIKKNGKSKGTRVRKS